MGTENGSQYAIQIAVQTLRDRCKNLQHRIFVLEEENVNLRVQCNQYETNTTNSITEQDKLRIQVVELEKQKDQLQEKIKMITGENQDLWSKLGKLTRVNKSLGNQLTQINNTISQHSANKPNLIRSKTFTRDELETKILQKNLEENDRISLELEDISLKLNDSFTKQKKELDLMCSEIEDIQFVETDDFVGEHCGFSYDDELDSDFVDEFKQVFNDLKYIKDEAIQHRDVLLRSLKEIEVLKETLRHVTTKPKMIHRSTTTGDVYVTVDKGTVIENNILVANDRSAGANIEKSNSIPINNMDKICPLCTKMFKKDVDFGIFQQHVEDHFTDIDSYEIL